MAQSLHKPIEKIPEHLAQYIAEQNPELYTPMDHACWRYVLKISQKFLSNHAHEKYLEGLKKTGISTDRIPLITEMDECLRKFGWRAVAVSGFIPPAVFMEFHALSILPIACDMRKMENLAYTPAPDIIHEAAGHAPILADPEYLEYLRKYGEIAKKAIFSEDDMRVYECIRHLSDTKENPNATETEILNAQKKLDHAVANVSYVSEATYLARMYWWTVEYGLVGSIDQPLIYGAGLLSSASESYHCLSNEVKKIPFTLDAVNMSYDITRPQPQLFVTPDFKTLVNILEEFSQSMAFYRGGEYGLTKALTAQTLTTVEYSSGLQVSGKLTEILQNQNAQSSYLIFKGPCQLSFANEELPGHGKNYHTHGFSSPLGYLKNSKTPLEDFTESDFKNSGIHINTTTQLEFESGVLVSGKVTKILQKNGKNILITFENAKVQFKERILFEPSWGTFDMACGSSIKSVFGGPADSSSYYLDSSTKPSHPPTHKTNLTPENKALNELYAEVRSLRNNKNSHFLEELETLYKKLYLNYKKDWLLRLEILELLKLKNIHTLPPWVDSLKKDLKTLIEINQKEKELMERGLQAIDIQL